MTEIPPDMYSFESVISVFGIIYVIFCLASFAKGLIAGLASNCGLLTVGILLLICATPGVLFEDGFQCLAPRIFSNSGKSISLKEIEAEDYKGLPFCGYGEIRDYENDRYYKDGMIFHLDHKVYAMHDKNAPGFYISPRIFHPAALIWIPGFFSLPVILAGAFVSSKIRN